MEGMHRNIALDPGLVRTKAYEIWQSMGCPDGVAEQTWLEAERQLSSRISRPAAQDGAIESRSEISSARHADARAEAKLEKASKARATEVASPTKVHAAGPGAGAAHLATAAGDPAAAAAAIPASEPTHPEPISQPPVSAAAATRKKGGSRRGRR